MEGSGRIRKGRASGAGRGAGEGRRGLRRPERPPLESRACRASASLGSGVASRSPLHLSLRPGGSEGARRGQPSSGAEEAAATTQRPSESRAAAAAVGISTRHGRGLASITADLPRPPCWEETTRHAAAERLQEEAAAAALPAQSCRGAGRQGVEGGARGEARAAALRRPGGVPPPPAFACRAAWGVAGALRLRGCRLVLFRPARPQNPRPWSCLYSCWIDRTSWLLSEFLEIPSVGAQSFSSRGHRNNSIAHSQPRWFSTCRAGL